MDCLTERENQWSLIFSVRYRKLNEIHLHYLLRYLPSWQFGSPVWSLQGSYPLLLTAHILLCIWPVQKRSHKISHVTNTVKNFKFFLYQLFKQNILMIQQHNNQWGKKCVLTSLMLFCAWDIVTISWLLTIPEYQVCCCENSDWDWKPCLYIKDKHGQL